MVNGNGLLFSSSSGDQRLHVTFFLIGYAFKFVFSQICVQPSQYIQNSDPAVRHFACWIKIERLRFASLHTAPDRLFSKLLQTTQDEHF